MRKKPEFRPNLAFPGIPECLAGAGGIEPCNNPLPHKDFSIPARPFDSIFDSKAKALVGTRWPTSRPRAGKRASFPS
jgi:hypothetical protein